jgi:hypothetical protein
MAYTYEYPRPAVTADCVVITKERLRVGAKAGMAEPILLTFIVVSTMAIFVLTRIEDHILKQILGVALIVISIYFALFSQKVKFSSTFPIRPSDMLSMLISG